MMHVPEANRFTDHPIERFRSTAADGNNGCFLLPSPEPGWALFCVASDTTDPEALGWEHVSVHAVHTRAEKRRIPNWREMCFVKDLFWDAEDVVMQLHPRKSQYVNHHPHVLHLWRPTLQQIPEPPAEFVGPVPPP